MNKNTVPKASPEPLPELASFLEPFAPLFRRHTSRDSLERYVTGLLTDLPHKTCETIADVMAGTSVERLQHLLTDAVWNPVALDEARVKRVLALHPVSDGILILDDTGLPKKGSASVGVAPQYSGTLGKIGTCQVVVSAQFLADDPASSTPFHWPVSAQLFLPEAWTQDAERGKQAQVPEEIGHQSKPEIAISLLDRARQWGVPIGMVVVDAGYGDNPNFVRGLDERQVPYVCVVESTFGCRLPEEVQAAAQEPPAYQGRGQPRKPRPAQLYTAKELIEALPASAWRTIAWREGTKGTMQVQAVAIRVHWATGSLRHSTSHSRVQTGPEGWLVAERCLSEPEKTKYRFSTLPPETSLQRLILLAHARWVIEQFYEDAKQECGFDHFQGRSWQGLHRHLALVLLAYSFLMLHRLTLPFPPDEAFSPLRQAKLAAWRVSPGAALALPGSRLLADPHSADRVLPAQEKLTK
jgi:SRSO17 transposase